jgi:hypothetical protein
MEPLGERKVDCHLLARYIVVGFVLGRTRGEDVWSGGPVLLD